MYDTRANIIRGRMRGDVFAGEKKFSNEFFVEVNGLVPGFWLKVFLSSAVVGGTINEADEEVL